MRFLYVLLVCACLWSALPAQSSQSFRSNCGPNVWRPSKTNAPVSSKPAATNLTTATDGLRIARPAAQAPSCCEDENRDNAITFISSKDAYGDSSSTGSNSCCGLVEGKNFRLSLASPSEHFGHWLKLQLFPTLCKSVLCRRQCALNGYESCNVLVHRGIIEDSIANNESCGVGGCHHQ